MEHFDEAEFKVQTQNMWNSSGTSNVLDCLIAMMESQLIILKKLKEITINERN